MSLRRAHPPRGREPHPLSAGGRPRGRGDRRGRRRRRDSRSARRSRRDLLHPGVREVPLLLDRPSEPVRSWAVRGRRLPPGRDIPLPQGRRGLRRLLRARHVLRPHGRVGVLVRADRRRHPVRGGVPRRVWRHDRLVLGGPRRRDASGRGRRDLRRRRRRDQRRAGRPLRRRHDRGRDRPEPVQARDGEQAWRDPHRRPPSTRRARRCSAGRTARWQTWR